MNFFEFLTTSLKNRKLLHGTFNAALQSLTTETVFNIVAIVTFAQFASALS